MKKRKQEGVNRETGKRMLLAFLGAFGLTLVYFLWAYHTFPFLYDINDDVAMRNVAAGVITGVPDAHLIHIKFVLGKLISGLYKMVPGFDWYGIVMVGNICFSLLILLYRGLEAQKPWLWKMAYIIITLMTFTCLGLRHLVLFQWTVTAGLIGGSGVFLFFTCRGKERIQTLWEESISVLCILLCLCIRDDVFWLVLPVAGVIFWWRYGSFRKGRIPFYLEHKYVPGALLCGLLLILGTEAFAYRSPQWKEFLSYNRDREAIMDYYGIPDYEEDMDFYHSIGMSEEEAVNLHRYSLYLVDGIYSGKMHALAQNAKELYQKANPPGKRLGMGAEKIYESLWEPSVLPLAAFAVSLMIGNWMLYARKREERKLSLVAALSGLFLLYWMYLGYRGRIVDRVVYTLLFLQAFAYLGILMDSLLEKPEENRKCIFEKGNILKFFKERWENPCMAFMVVLSLLVICHGQIKELGEESKGRRDYNQQFLEINRYMAERMENIYFMTTFSIETYTDNFTLRRDFAFTNLLSVGGWHSFSELENEKIRKLGIDGQSMEHAILTEADVYVISLVNVDYMDRYFTGKYGADYQGRKEIDVQTYGDTDFTVYQFRIEENGEDEKHDRL